MVDTTVTEKLILPTSADTARTKDEWDQVFGQLVQKIYSAAEERRTPTPTECRTRLAELTAPRLSPEAESELDILRNSIGNDPAVLTEATTAIRELIEDTTAKGKLFTELYSNFRQALVDMFAHTGQQITPVQEQLIRIGIIRNILTPYVDKSAVTKLTQKTQHI